MTDKDNLEPIPTQAYKCPICYRLYETVEICRFCISIDKASIEKQEEVDIHEYCKYL
jgi:hypothetical protein